MSLVPHSVLRTASGFRPQENPSGTPPHEVGGQALLDGVLIRSRSGYAVAARRPDGRIAIEQRSYTSLAVLYYPFRMPVLRGMASLVDMTVIGSRGLEWSAAVAAGSSARLPELPDRATSAFAGWRPFAVLVMGLALALVMIVVLPSVLTDLFGLLPPLATWASDRGTLGFFEENHPWAFHAISGMMRIAIVAGYAALIGRIDEVRRVFSCHGAEHRAVQTFEDEASLEVAEATRRPITHPRCGTTFLALLLILLIPAFGGVSALLSATITGLPDAPYLSQKGAYLLAQILALPILAGLCIELLKVLAPRIGRRPARFVAWPGLALQRLTTRRPTPREEEVALIALLAALDIAPGARVSRRYVVRGLHEDDEQAENPAPTETTP